MLEELLPQDASVCDIGSGAGLPGLVLAIARPDLRITLVEPLLRRTTFLSEVVAELELTGVEVVRERADALHGVRRFDVVTSRAVAPLSRLLAWSMPLVAPEGALVAMKGSSIEQEIVDAAATLSAFGCAEPEVRVLGAELLESGTTTVRVAWQDPAQVSWPPAAVPESTTAGRRQRKNAKRRQPK